MADPADALPALARVEADGEVRNLATDPRIRIALDCRWGGVRAIQLRAGPIALPEGHALAHVVALNLGAETECEARLEGGAWAAVRVAHHAVGALPALLRHEVRSRESCELLVVALEPGLVDATLGSGASLLPLSPAPDSFAMHVMLALADEARTGEGEATGTREAHSLAVALVTHLAARERGPPAPLFRIASLESPRLRAVLEYVSRHLDAPLTLGRLAEIAGLDVFKFVRAFKQSTGLSPHRYVLEARIARAKELLRAHSNSITDIALLTGFATPSHFSVTFRRITHQTPRAYRDGPGS